MRFVIFILFLVVASCAEKTPHKISNEYPRQFFDKNGVLMSEYLDSIHSIAYQYYKNKNLYKIQYLRDHCVNGQIDEVFVDSTVLYNMNAKKLLFFKFLRNEQPGKLISKVKIFKPNGLESDSTVNSDQVEVIEKVFIGKDSNQLQYQPLTDF